MPASRRVLLAVLAPLLLAGCTSDAKTWGPVTAVVPSDGGADALASGLLTITNSCVYLQQDADEALEDSM
jgi:hypothetical protein